MHPSHPNSVEPFLHDGSIMLRCVTHRSHRLPKALVTQGPQGDLLIVSPTSMQNGIGQLPPSYLAVDELPILNEVCRPPIQCQRGCTFFLHVILVYVLAMQVVACCLEELCEQKSKTVV